MDIYLFRHGHTASSAPIRFIHDGKDDPLSHEGESVVRESAQKLFNKISPTKHTQIICLTSPQLRAKQTAGIVQSVFASKRIPFDELREMPHLREVNFGRIEGKYTWKDVDRLDPQFGKKIFIDQAYDYTPIGGECYRDVEKRSVQEVMRFLKEQKKYCKVAILTCHAGNIRAWYKSLCDIRVEVVPYASWHRFAI